jgi:hypothetical protein
MGDVFMKDQTWELTILDGAPNTREINAVAAADIDGDGHVEVIYGGMDEVAWYRPATLERGVVAKMHTGVGGFVSDIDGDGKLEFAASDANKISVDGKEPAQGLYWFKPGKNLNDTWQKFTIDTNCAGQAHDVIFADIDNDGKDELIVNAVYSATPGLYAYKPGSDIKAPWQKIKIQSGFVEEGLAAGDLDGDGYVEIISGADWYKRPTGGPLTDNWERHIYAPSHREMCRVALLDVTGNGRPDIFVVDSEYFDGKLSWFENRLGKGEKQDWIEHVLDTGLIYAHSLGTRTNKKGESQVFCAEMGQGGWGAPRNWNARVIEFVSGDKGATWKRTVISKGEGTHEAMFVDIDADGEAEIVGKDAFEDVGGVMGNPRPHFWKKPAEPSVLTKFHHRFLDRDKPEPGVDLLTGDIDGDGQPEIFCGKWWYPYDGSERRVIPGIHQALALHDLDGDGKLELVAMKPAPGQSHFWDKLTPHLVWLKPIDLASDKWEEHEIGKGEGNWPHGMLIAPLLPGNKLAMVTGYHSASKGSKPEIWEVPSDPTKPWPKRILADIKYGEEFVAADIDGDGKLDIVAGATWLENNGDGTFTPHVIAEGFVAARVAVADFNGDGRPDILLGEEIFDFEKRVTRRSGLVWLENPKNPKTDKWTVHTVDKVRCAHSVAAADLDGDGEPEIICGEHDPFWPYRNQCRLLVYKKADRRPVRTPRRRKSVYSAQRHTRHSQPRLDRQHLCPPVGAEALTLFSVVNQQ